MPPRRPASPIEQHLLDHPDDGDAYLVYADWLQERGDPRGRLIAMQHAQGESGDAADAALRQAEAAWRAQHTRALVGRTDRLSEAYRFEWRLGHVRRALVSLAAYRNTERARLDKAVRALLEAPAAWLLRELWLDVEDRAAELRDAFALVAAERPATLAQLVLVAGSGRDDVEPWWARERYPGWPAPPVPTEDDIWTVSWAGGFHLRGGHTPRLPGMTLELADMERGLVPSPELHAAVPPGCRFDRLQLWVPDGGYASVYEIEGVPPPAIAGPIAQLEAILDLTAPGAADLRHLDLRHVPTPVLAQLARAPVLAQLLTLTIQLRADQAEMLLAHAEAFRHLAGLRVVGHEIVGDVAERIVDVLPQAVIE